MTQRQSPSTFTHVEVSYTSICTGLPCISILWSTWYVATATSSLGKITSMSVIV